MWGVRVLEVDPNNARTTPQRLGEAWRCWRVLREAGAQDVSAVSAVGQGHPACPLSLKHTSICTFGASTPEGTWFLWIGLWVAWRNHRRGVVWGPLPAQFAANQPNAVPCVGGDVHMYMSFVAHLTAPCLAAMQGPCPAAR